MRKLGVLLIHLGVLPFHYIENYGFLGRLQDALTMHYGRPSKNLVVSDAQDDRESGTLWMTHRLPFNCNSLVTVYFIFVSNVSKVAQVWYVDMLEKSINLGCSISLTL